MKIYPNRPSYETLSQPVPNQTQFGSHFGTKPGPKLVLVEVGKDLAVIGTSCGPNPNQIRGQVSYHLLVHRYFGPKIFGKKVENVPLEKHEIASN